MTTRRLQGDEFAADHKLDADPASVRMIELGLDTAHSETIAPVWAALLIGNAEAQGHGSPSDEIRDATGRLPNLWFGDADEHETPRQRFHVEVDVAPKLADQDGNTGVLCVAQAPATKDRTANSGDPQPDRGSWQ